MALRLSKTVKLINLEIFSIWEMAYPSSSWADPLDSASFCYNDRKLWCYKVGCLSNIIKFINHFLWSNFKKHNINVIRVICPVYNLHIIYPSCQFPFHSITPVHCEFSSLVVLKEKMLILPARIVSTFCSAVVRDQMPRNTKY